MAWVEKSPTRGKWRGGFRDHEGKMRRRTFDTRSAALAWAYGMEGVPTDRDAVIAVYEAQIRDLQSKIAAIKNGGEVAPGLGLEDVDQGSKVPTFREFAVRFLTLKKTDLEGSSYRGYRGVINNSLIPFFGDMPMNAIYSDHVQEWYGTLTNSARTNNYYLSVLAIIFNKAIEMSHERQGGVAIASFNPARKKRAKVGDSIRRDIFTAEQEVDLLERAKAHDQWVYDISIMGLDTGVRRGEAIGLPIDAVDFDRNTVSIYQQADDTGKIKRYTKDRRNGGANSQWRAIPITPRLRRILKRRIAEARLVGSDLVFQVNGEAIKAKGWDKMWEAITDRDFHELRVTYITRLLEDPSVPVDRVRALAGHSRLSITEGYRRTDWSEGEQDTIIEALKRGSRR